METMKLAEERGLGLRVVRDGNGFSFQHSSSPAGYDDVSEGAGLRKLLKTPIIPPSPAGPTGSDTRPPSGGYRRQKIDMWHMEESPVMTPG